jgi:hypothetical protein
MELLSAMPNFIEGSALFSALSRFICRNFWLI